MMTEEYGDPSPEKTPRRSGKGVALKSNLSKEVMEVVGKARLISYDSLFSIFQDIPEVTLYKCLQVLKGSFDSNTGQYKTPRYLEVVESIKHPKLTHYVKKMGRKHPLLAPGPACQEFLGADYPLKHNNIEDEPKLHMMMGSQFAATLHAAAHKKLIRLLDYKREPRRDKLPVGSIHAPEIDEQQKTLINPDANTIVEPMPGTLTKDILDKYKPFSFHEDETGTVHITTADLRKKKSSWQRKVVLYNRLHNEYVKQGKHPPFYVRVVCLEPDRADVMRRFAWEFNPKANFYRFILFKYVNPENPNMLISEKRWYDFNRDTPLSYFE